MSGKSNYLENLILNWIKGSAFASAPSGVYVGLFNGDPTDAGSGGTEVTTTDVDFGNAAGDATISHFALFDAASAGNMLYSGPLTGGTQSVSSGTGVKFNSGSLTVSED
jgi:hypothetical protein